MKFIILLCQIILSSSLYALPSLESPCVVSTCGNLCLPRSAKSSGDITTITSACDASTMSIQKCVTGAECKLQRKTGTCGWTVSKKMQACLLNQHEQAMEELDSIVQGGGRKRKGGAVVKANYGITSTSSSKKARLASAAVKNNSFRTTSNTDSPLPIGMLDDRIALLLKKKEQQQLVKRDLTSDSEGHTSSYEEEFGVPIGMIDESLEKYTKKSSTARRLPSSSSGFTVSQATAQKLIDQLQQHQKIGAIDGSLVARKSKKQPKDLKHLLKHY